MWGATGLDKELVPAWNVSMKGNDTWDNDFGINFASVENQKFMKLKCEEVANQDNVVATFDKDKADVSVVCWTKMFIEEYMLPKFMAKTKCPGTKERDLLDKFIADIPKGGKKLTDKGGIENTYKTSEEVAAAIAADPRRAKDLVVYPIEDKA